MNNTFSLIKFLIILSILGMFCSETYGQIKTHSIKKTDENVFGIKSVNNEYLPDLNEYKGRYIESFDRDGKLTSSADFFAYLDVNDSAINVRWNQNRYYNDNGLIIRYVNYNDSIFSDSTIHYIDYKYNEKKEVISDSCYTIGEELYKKTIYYNDTSKRQDNYGLSIRTYKDTTIKSLRLNYSEKYIDKNIKQNIFYNTSDTLIVTEYKNEEGLLVKKNNNNITYKQNKIINFEYSDFDEFKNWRKQIKYENGYPTNITIRKIEYY
jgi:hypothetical protein